MVPVVQNKVLNWSKSESLSNEISKVIPGGVNSPFRSFREVGGHTLFIEKGEGAFVFDVDGNKYIDYVGAWGPSILGHANEKVLKKIKRTLDKGALFGAPHTLELELAQKIIDMVPSVENIRFVNSGTEAVMSSIRLARGFTGKDKVIMFEGCYHGHSDSTLKTNKQNHSKGIPDSFGANTVEATFNDLNSVDKLFEKNKGEIACVIVEPVTGSMGVIEPEPDFLAGLRSLCTKYDAILIFDEVLTGFRVAYGGAQCLYNVKPDITCFGKLLGGGMPIGAYGGKKEIMDQLMPLGKVYQAGTFSGNPLSMAGGVATLELLNEPGVYDSLERQSNKLFQGLEGALDKVFQEADKPIRLVRVGSMFSILFAGHPVTDFNSSESIDEKLFAKVFQAMLTRGVYLPPSAYDAACLSTEHNDSVIEETIAVFEDSLKVALAT